MLCWLVHFTQRSWDHSRRKEERGSIVSSMILLNKEGLIYRKLQLVSLPDDYIVPEGMTISWRMDMRTWSHYPLATLSRPEPVEAYFYLGSARGQVCRGEVKMYEQNGLGPMRYGSRNLTITVQGTSAKDVMELRDRIMHIIKTCAHFPVSNDLNPKPKIGFLRWLFGIK